MNIKRLFGAAALLLASAAWGQTLESIRLTDVIKSQGSGNIDLFKDADAATLEQFRLDHGGMLVFAVDINEDASGTEKASSQGVSVQSITFTVTYNTGDVVVVQSSIEGKDIYSETQALLAQFPSSTRSPYYTLLGESGSSRITSGNVYQDQFDSTIKVNYTDSLSTAERYATAAVLDIVLLRTNESLGDPEAFYDYSAGFEDLALVTFADAEFIDDYAAGRDEAPTVILTNDPLLVTNWNYFPSATGHFIVGYEDLYPRLGDYDFNDLTVAYQVRIGTNFEGDIMSIGGTAYLLTRGAAFSHNWHLAMNLAGGASGIMNCFVTPNPNTPNVSEACPAVPSSFGGELLDIEVFTDTWGIFPDPWGSYFTNTYQFYSDNGRYWVNGPRTDFMLDLDQPLPRESLSEAPFDPYLYVRNTGQTIKLMEVDPSFVDENGFPFGMLLVHNWKPPAESRDTRNVYSRFNSFVSSQGAADANWYLDYFLPWVINMPETWNW